MNSYAGDCREVKFEFNNKWKVAGTGVEIKVKKIAIVGNDGSWNENINNKTIQPNKKHTTNKRKLNKLDSGKSGTFTVHLIIERLALAGSLLHTALLPCTVLMVKHSDLQ